MEARLILLRAPLPEIRLQLPNGVELFSLRTREGRLLATKAFLNGLTECPEEVRLSRLEGLRIQLPSDILDRLMDQFGELRLMSWEQLPNSRRGATVIAHGSLHSPLSKHETTQVLEREVVESKATLERALARQWSTSYMSMASAHRRRPD